MSFFLSTSYTNLLLHVIIRTKYSRDAFPNEHAEKLYRYIWGFVRGKKCVLHRINGIPNHLHLLVDLHPSIAVSDFVKELKTSTHAWLKKQHTIFPDFIAWGSQYAALAVSEADKERVVAYIARQREHHKVVNFENEYRKILQENGINPDEQYWLKD